MDYFDFIVIGIALGFIVSIVENYFK